VSAGSFSTWIGSDRVVAQTLSDALKKNPQAKKFRLRWILLGNAKGPLHCQIVYNRPSKQLSELSIYTGRDKQFMYTNVTDNAIHALAQQGSPMYRLKGEGGRFGVGPGFLARMKHHVFRWFGW
jgi:hypothetical protein